MWTSFAKLGRVALRARPCWTFARAARLGSTARSFGTAGGAAAAAPAALELVNDTIAQALDERFFKVQSVDADTSGVHVVLQASTGAYPKADVENLREQLLALDGVADANISVDLVRPRPAQRTTAPGLQNVAKIIAVSSCKGGVGKSTIATNLAFQVAAMGGRVGLIDADIYGPSLPVLVKLPEGSLPIRKSKNNDLIGPPEYNGVKLMSYGWIAKPADQQSEGNGSNGMSYMSDSAAVLRGPMVSQIVSQIIQGTDWGDLDYLFVDMPPGTGDIHITVCQDLKLDGAVVVTTPQKLSLVDVVKGIEMFGTLKVPVMGLVENMAHFDVPGTGERYYPFGRGSAEAIVKKFEDIKESSVFTMPIRESFSAAGENGTPAVVVDSTVRTQDFGPLAEHLVATVATAALHSRVEGAVQVKFDEQRGIVLRIFSGDLAGSEFVINPAALRRDSRDAASINEMTGEQILDPASVSDDVKPLKIDKRGNYGVAIEWDDGHQTAIYTYEQMIALADPSH